MASKQELIDGVEFLIREARRIGDRFDADGAEWSMPGDDGGWNARQVFCHVAGIGTITPQFIEGLGKAPAGTDAGASVDIDTVNAGLVQQRDGATGRQAVDELADAYGKVIEWVKATPESTFEQRATLGGYKNMTLSDIMMQAIVMHGIQHIYRAASRFPMAKAAAGA